MEKLIFVVVIAVMAAIGTAMYFATRHSSRKGSGASRSEEENGRTSNTSNRLKKS